MRKTYTYKPSTEDFNEVFILPHGVKITFANRFYFLMN